MCRCSQMHLLCIKKLKNLGRLQLQNTKVHVCLYVPNIPVCISPDFLLFQSSSSAHQCNHDSKLGDRPDLISASLFASLAYGGDALSLSLFPCWGCARIAALFAVHEPPATGSLSPAQRRHI
ncbi:hypothetical protein M431DRAFT_181027 [Trichoderma harzianum CBS 226.95]|uniref:Uncharacterized protein n=1 Tax=Trichoderma harzianum CBS 226.95 TaxID=983964 RepID=A0A2T4ATP1_TRIHA|nr:hypothetical protein M431DRAFT_181027 [Trichoderma harzianum CBS 226.95]PTB60433.1 hypothetical protein M431DRAFT_181027 [Trichoderma harzianum CBS 226.95]